MFGNCLDEIGKGHKVFVFLFFFSFFMFSFLT
jgi:hypothetical protein